MFNINNNEKEDGFSLVELMVTLIVVSCLMAALAPVITKKLKSNKVSVVGGGGGSSSDISTNCSSIDKECALCSLNKCLVCKKGGYLFENNDCVKWGEPRNQEDCDPYNALYIKKEWNGGVKAVCVAKYNAGDENGPDIATGVTVAGTATSCTGGNCCWKGTTSDNCSLDDGHGSAYSGCTRTVCQQLAAKSICLSWAPQNHGIGVKTWRLPKEYEAQGWFDNRSSLNESQGANGLQFCYKNADDAANAGVNRCSYRSNSCKGSYGDGSAKNVCHPHDIWLDSETVVLLFANNFGIGPGESSADRLKYYAFSTRCVTDNVLYPETVNGSE